MTAVALERHELSRWALSAAVVIAIHAAAAMLLWSWHEPVTGDAIGDAIVVDLSAFTGPPAESKYDLPPGPLQPQVDAAPQPEPPRPEEQRREKTELPPQPNDVTLPTEQIKPVEKQDRADQPVVETAPPRISPSAAQVTSWHRKIAEQVERHKGYPSAARARRQTGVAEVVFTIDRQGKVVTSRVTRSSGYAALDQETIATVRRAQPFPSPPTNMPGDTFEFRVPIRFNIE